MSGIFKYSEIQENFIGRFLPWIGVIKYPNGVKDVLYTETDPVYFVRYGISLCHTQSKGYYWREEKVLDAWTFPKDIDIKSFKRSSKTSLCVAGESNRYIANQELKYKDLFRRISLRTNKVLTTKVTLKYNTNKTQFYCWIFYSLVPCKCMAEVYDFKKESFVHVQERLRKSKTVLGESLYHQGMKIINSW